MDLRVEQAVGDVDRSRIVTIGLVVGGVAARAFAEPVEGVLEQLAPLPLWVATAIGAVGRRHDFLPVLDELDGVQVVRVLRVRRDPVAVAQHLVCRRVLDVVVVEPLEQARLGQLSRGRSDDDFPESADAEQRRQDTGEGRVDDSEQEDDDDGHSAGR